MKKKFKVGQRVATYGYYGRILGKIDLTNDEPDGFQYHVLPDDLSPSFWVHEKQCRRLVKRKKVSDERV